MEHIGGDAFIYNQIVNVFIIIIEYPHLILYSHIYVITK